VLGREHQYVDGDATVEGVSHRRANRVDVSQTLREEEHAVGRLMEQPPGFSLTRLADVDHVKQVFGRAELVDTPITNWRVRVDERRLGRLDLRTKLFVGVSLVLDGSVDDVGRLVWLVLFRSSRDQLHEAGRTELVEDAVDARFRYPGCFCEIWCGRAS